MSLAAATAQTACALAEIANSYGKPAYLIDGANEIDPAWFKGANTVLVTAGASAPEAWCWSASSISKANYGATVETRTIREEDVSFQLPKELRSLTLVN